MYTGASEDFSGPHVNPSPTFRVLNFVPEGQTPNRPFTGSLCSGRCFLHSTSILATHGILGVYNRFFSTTAYLNASSFQVLIMLVLFQVFAFSSGVVVFLFLLSGHGQE